MLDRIPSTKELNEWTARGDTIPEELLTLAVMKEQNPIIKGKVGGDELKFLSGSTITSLSADKGRGRTADRVIIDEAAFISLSKSRVSLVKVLRSAGPALERAGGQLILISTANGMGLFYTIFLNAIKKRTSYVAFFFSCWDDPTFTEEARAQKIIDDGEDSVNQEFPRTWREAFLSSGSPRFNVKLIKDYYEPLAEQHHPIARGNIVNDNGFRQVVELNDNGFINFYQRRDPRAHYMIVCDIAEGINRGGPGEGKSGDYTHGKVYSLATMEQVATFHGHLEPGEFGQYVARMGRHWNNAIIVIEHNNHGGGVLIELRRHERYPDALLHCSRIKHREHDQDKGLHPEIKWGWETNLATKPVIIDNLALMIQRKQVPWFPPEDLPELYAYIRGDRGATNAEEGEHDDRVMSNSIGHYIFPQYQKPPMAEWQFCANCSSFDEQRESEGRCKRSGRWCQHSDVCRLWRDAGPYQHKMAKKIGSEQRRRLAEAGYR